MERLSRNDCVCQTFTGSVGVSEEGAAAPRVPSGEEAWHYILNSIRRHDFGLETLSRPLREIRQNEETTNGILKGRLDGLAEMTALRQ